jgi:hypothetical protein
MNDSKPLRPRQKGRHLNKVRVVTIATLILAVAGISTAVLSKNQGLSKGRQESAKTKRYVATRAIIFDQASGQLRKPTVEETQALVSKVSAITNRSSEGLRVTSYPNGMKVMDSEGRFGSVVLGRANADGTTEVRCVFSMEEAAEFLGLEEVITQE